MSLDIPRLSPAKNIQQTTKSWGRPWDEANHMVGLTYAYLSQRQTFGRKEVSHCSSQTHSMLKFDNFRYTPSSEDK